MRIPLPSLRASSGLLVGTLLSVAVLVFFRTDVTNVQRDGGFLISVAYEFDGIKWLAAGLILALWALLAVARITPVGINGTASTTDYLVVALIGYAAVSLAWAPDLKAGVLALVHGGVAASAYFMMRITHPRTAAKILLAFGATTTIGAALISAAVEREAHGGAGNANFLAELVAVSGAILAAFAFDKNAEIRWGARALTVLAVLFVVTVPDANLHLLSFAAVAIFVVAWRGRFRTAAILLTVAVVAAIVLGSMVLNGYLVDRLPLNVLDRMQIWTSTLLQIRQAPFFGNGIGSFFHEAGNFTDSYRTIAPSLGAPAYDNYARQATSADNELLRLVSDLGLVGGVFAVLLAVALLLRCLRHRHHFVGRLGFAVSAAIPLGLVSQTFENALTLVPLAMVAGCIARGSEAGAGKEESATRMAQVAAAIAVICLVAFSALLLPVTRASIRFSIAESHSDLASQYGYLDQIEAAADQMLLAIKHSTWSPRVRLRVFPQVMIAGGQFQSQRGLTSDDVEELYELSASASPENTLLLDIRLKQLLSSTGRVVRRSEIEALLGKLQRKIGWHKANPHILEAAFALQIGDKDRARAALAQAEVLIGDPPGANDLTNLRNIESLKRQLEQ